MDKYVVLTNDVTRIDINSYGDLVQACQLWSRTNPSIYRNYPFTESTGYVKTVYEEIEFVIECQEKGGGSVWNVNQFISLWGFQEYLDYDILDLSGGWRKYLGLALFTNRTSTCRIYFDATRHISSNRLSLFMANLDKCPGREAIFFEYDATKLLTSDFKTLYDYNGTLSVEKWEDSLILENVETNYG